MSGVVGPDAVVPNMNKFTLEAVAQNAQYVRVSGTYRAPTWFIELLSAPFYKEVSGCMGPDATNPSRDALNKLITKRSSKKAALLRNINESHHKWSV